MLTKQLYHNIANHAQELGISIQEYIRHVLISELNSNPRAESKSGSKSESTSIEETPPKKIRQQILKSRNQIRDYNSQTIANKNDINKLIDVGKFTPIKNYDDELDKIDNWKI
ncbi:MAG: hypothetical protein US52_C0009G0015 [candidate division WS6 bacterium GW2011_GWA2_37_6]|uniref:Uncharacterized protein n=1 Tax=candidate division WS6 bacterium GW2011_GWA2_37_6 TaxID=1619087 RepID=A0A0G0GYT8_9BACT|nr:MAG: hypothetical protein US52_C0009G0015 [candidate division WS6 bacterium GW2011_GWA2_37_6]